MWFALDLTFHRDASGQRQYRAVPGAQLLHPFPRRSAPLSLAAAAVMVTVASWLVDRCS